ncbi:MAG: rhomboid family intramembrane serine protease [Planctomycetaceae bacterium]
MRRIHIFEQTDPAKRLAASLNDRGVAVAVRPEPEGGAGLWVLDEDRLATARDELAAFEANPNDERFRVRTVSNRQAPPEEAPRRHERSTAWPRSPVTFMLIGISIVVTLVTLLSEPLGFGDAGWQVRSDLSIVGYEVDGDSAFWYPSLGLSDIRSGQIWRLVTPIFPHGDPLHLLFNMGGVWLLGRAIETMRGSLRLMLLVLATAVLSNIAEYYFNLGFTFNMQDGLQSQTGFAPDPFFLGMSGVVFGLFGFVWVQSRLLPRSGFAMPQDMVVWMMIWLIVCTTGLVGPIANVAHGMGLLAGMAIGAAPRLWRRK